MGRRRDGCSWHTAQVFVSMSLRLSLCILTPLLFGSWQEDNHEVRCSCFTSSSVLFRWGRNSQSSRRAYNIWTAEPLFLRIVINAMVFLTGKISQSKWCNLLKASHWSKWQLSVVTRSYKHITSDGSKIRVRVDTTCPSGNCFGKFLAAFFFFSLVSKFYSSVFINRCRGSTRKNTFFSNSLWINSEYPNLLKNMFIWSL
jgi:hypothetical protein